MFTINPVSPFSKSDVNILKAPNDNNFLNRVAITFNDQPKKIRSQTTSLSGTLFRMLDHTFDILLKMLLLSALLFNFLY